MSSAAAAAKSALQCSDTAEVTQALLNGSVVDGGQRRRHHQKPGLGEKKKSNESEESRKEEVRGCEGGKQEREVRTRKEGSAEEVRAVEEKEEEVIRPAGDNRGAERGREIGGEGKRYGRNGLCFDDISIATRGCVYSLSLSEPDYSVALSGIKYQGA
ncbi:hypothetical protein MTO96_047671 [Rhipicephalus appendiculatus]